jgi:DNA-directed RNA polymerase omega subunit
MSAIPTVPRPYEIDAKFRFVTVAVQRARQLRSGSKPRVASGVHKDLWIAMHEVLGGHVSWELEEPRVKV